MMKTICMVLAVLLMLLSGCAAQANSSAAVATTAVQTERGPASETSEAAPQTAASEAAAETEAVEEETVPETEQNETEEQMRLLIGATEVPVTWEKNASVEALRALCPLTIEMSMYGGFEQVGPIGRSIVRSDAQTDTSYGDIVLYSGNQIVIFYGSNSWSYTRLGHVELPEQELRELLSRGDVTITLK